MADQPLLDRFDEWRREGATVRGFYKVNGAFRKGWIKEGAGRDWVEKNGQRKAEHVARYMRTGFL